MIRIDRPSTVPTSLSTPAVRQYIQDIIAYKADSSLPEPKKPGSYRTADLLEAFDTYFYRKCYLTEERFESSYEMDVDHFEPANQNPARVYDWNNLYPAAHKANMMRPRRLPPGGLLDPCTDDVETDIIYSLEAMGEEPGFKARDAANQRAVNTAQLLNELHNGKPGNSESNNNTRELRRAIERKYKMVQEAWARYRDAEADNDLQDIASAETALRALLSRRASFTMLMRSLPFVRKRIPAHLLD
ncbi:HNH endonuclease family protein [Hymenobacter guriensis]|uniref:HNH nuclease domain-containing protein n=1 Tax=Hymenobacter guriensis TaxID=2793065 RepID=A0ABS0L0J6_9BACT|nr:hypothetical protein [Hymenobacter guriensis]MBG8553639.1 hypothetical protein [Hymenobacter guriensis]